MEGALTVRLFFEILTQPRTFLKTFSRRYEAKSGDWMLMMLPSDMALLDDPSFRGWVEKYAEDEEMFFKDFSAAFGKLIALNCPQKCQPGFRLKLVKGKATANAKFRELSMHGSTHLAKELHATGNVNPHSVESSSARTALHKVRASTAHEHKPFSTHLCVCVS